MRHCAESAPQRLLFWGLRVLPLALAILLAACTPQLGADWGNPTATPAPVIGDHSLRTADGLDLPLRLWQPQQAPHAVIVGLHGFNDYSATFAEAGPWWAAEGFAVYAYDQRGFGSGPRHGEWGGTQALSDDLRRLCAALRQRYPMVPLIVVGESMGGAVALIAAADGQDHGQPLADGLVLAAPAVWGRASMPWSYQVTLALAVRLAPSMTLSGKGLGIWPTDNIEMLRGLAADPLMVRQTRIDAIWGLTNLMDSAADVAQSARLTLPILWLYGAHDEVVPPRPMLHAATAAIQGHPQQRFVLYDSGWHMLLRDLQGEAVLADIAVFARNQTTTLPFGAVRDPAAILSGN